MSVTVFVILNVDYDRDNIISEAAYLLEEH